MLVGGGPRFSLLLSSSAPIITDLMRNEANISNT